MNARQAARRRERRRRLGIAAVLAVVLVAAIGGLALAAASRDRQPVIDSGPHAGLQTGPAPWGANTAGLAERLQAIGVPLLSPVEGTALHIHQHLDLHVDGHRVVVPRASASTRRSGSRRCTPTTPAGSCMSSRRPCAATPSGSSSPCGGCGSPQLPRRLLRRRGPPAAGVRERPALPG